MLGSWQETPESIKQLKDLPSDEPLFEGYGDHPTFRKHIGSLGSQGDVVKLDGIGGSAILAKGDLFRSKFMGSRDITRRVVKTSVVLYCAIKSLSVCRPCVDTHILKVQHLLCAFLSGGLNFPSVLFEHAVETEGLAKLSLAMGTQPFGMPHVHVVHK